ncbi:MAG: 4-vinyl reductase [Candidatus Parvarchaeota archaeon]|nr:4-vinyl reductase [Candidatus Jingweiarchaeum tengchongense]MCW1305851.1 4-vinyl reductase [Candidatus Jingweiarchaeum tengchongense]MCW1309146.1 4-vinyl reductase [Candidatus Jingweiarchaeum tengchongense]
MKMEEFDATKHFAKLLASGQFKVEKDGRILIEGINIVAMPALTLAKLWKEVPPEILYEAGKYQAQKAVEVHTKYFGFTKSVIPKLLSGIMDKVIEFSMSTYSAVSGLGQFQIQKYDKEKKEILIVNKTNIIARCYFRDFGKSDKPIDHFLVGLFEGMANTMGVNVKCVESKCIACGDEACIFIIKEVGDNR